jgi:hypothetical protein
MRRLQMAIENKNYSHWVLVRMPVSSIVKRKRPLIDVTVTLLRNGLLNPNLYLYLGPLSQENI